MSKNWQDFERTFAVELGLWWCGREDVFWRSSGSGARATTRAKRGKATAGQHGDIAATDPVGAPLMAVLSFELKDGYSSQGIHDLLDHGWAAGKPGSAVKDWEIFLRKAYIMQESAGSWAWLLVTHRARRVPWVWGPAHLYTELTELGAFQKRPRLAVSLQCPVRDTRGAVVRYADIFGLPKEYFFARVTPDHIMDIYAQTKTTGKTG
jgi:hypothetical protein